MPHQSNSVAQRSAGSTRALAPRRGAGGVGKSHHPRHVDQFAVQRVVAGPHAPVLAQRKAPRRGERQQRFVGWPAVRRETPDTRPEAHVQQRHLAGIRLHDAQQLVGIVIRPEAFGRARRPTSGGGGSPSSQYAWRNRSGASQVVPKPAQVTPQQERACGRLRASRSSPRSSGRNASGPPRAAFCGCQGGSISISSSKSDGQRMPGDLRLVGQQGRGDAGTRRKQPRPAWAATRRRRTHRVPALPVRTVQSLQVRANRPGPGRTRASGWPADPSPAFRSTRFHRRRAARVQPIDDQADGIHAAIVADVPAGRKPTVAGTLRVP